VEKPLFPLFLLSIANLNEINLFVFLFQPLQQVIDWGINTPFQLCMPNHDLKEYRMIFTLSTVLVFVLPMTVITILYILIALQLRQSVVKRGNASGSSVRLKVSLSGW
jgi:hypothetical protein